jgi:translation initiation factor IF-2
VAGYGCQPSADATFTEHGRWTDGLSGFISVGAGGPNAAGCDGGFDAMPMSGSMSHNAPGNYALWTFRTGLVQQQTCDVSVYIPADSSDEHVGGNPAVYQVFGSAGPAGPELGAFDINQPARRGGWVSEPGWPITAGQLTVRLDSYGIDWAGNTETHAHIAVSAIRVTCVP